MLAVVVIWAIFTLAGGGAGKRKPAANGNAIPTAGITAADLQSMQASLPGSNLTAYMEKAAAPSTADPFENADLPPTNSITSAPAFIYSGHIKVGSREIAVINGQEYFEGELLSTGDYIVEQVNKEKVLLRGKTNGESKEVFLVETLGETDK